ncbi:hypothetical protein NFI96_028750 [Prochilodus magdalenae]|nr:hypothetical protein NFI96_028750 [Prochilodus magdalenae]
MSFNNIPSKSEVMSWDPPHLADFLRRRELSGCDKVIMKCNMNGQRFLNMSDNDLQKFPKLHAPLITKICREINKKEEKSMRSIFQKRNPAPAFQETVEVVQDDQGWDSEEFESDYETPDSNDEGDGSGGDYESPAEEGGEADNDYEPPPSEPPDDMQHHQFRFAKPMGNSEYIDRGHDSVKSQPPVPPARPGPGPPLPTTHGRGGPGIKSALSLNRRLADPTRGQISPLTPGTSEKPPPTSTRSQKRAQRHGSNTFPLPRNPSPRPPPHRHGGQPESAHQTGSLPSRFQDAAMNSHRSSSRGPPQQPMRPPDPETGAEQVGGSVVNVIGGGVQQVAPLHCSFVTRARGRRFQFGRFVQTEVHSEVHSEVSWADRDTQSGMSRGAVSWRWRSKTRRDSGDAVGVDMRHLSTASFLDKDSSKGSVTQPYTLMVLYQDKVFNIQIRRQPHGGLRGLYPLASHPVTTLSHGGQEESQEYSLYSDNFYSPPPLPSPQQTLQSTCELLGSDYD